MSQEETSVLLIVLIAVVSLLGVALATVSMTTNRSFGGMMTGGSGMMNGTNAGPTTTSRPGPVEWTVLILSVVFLGLALVLFVRGRARSSAPLAPTAVPPTVMGVPAAPSAALLPAIPTAPPALAPTVVAAMASASPASAPEAVPEPALMKLLDQDERTMYLEIRDHGGSMLQRDLVALGIFSKAKVTRVLDRLEAKDLVVREAHGMTNRVRLVNRAK